MPPTQGLSLLMQDGRSVEQVGGTMIPIHPKQNDKADSMKSVQVYISHFTTHEKYLVSEGTGCKYNNTQLLLDTDLYCSALYLSLITATT